MPIFTMVSKQWLEITGMIYLDFNKLKFAAIPNLLFLECLPHFLFENANLDVIFCGHFLWNEQSHRVQEKSGFKHYAFDTYETAFGTTEENEVNILKRGQLSHSGRER